MAELFDYLEWRGDLTFLQDPLNQVDGLIFAALSYADFSDVVCEDFQTPISLEEAACRMRMTQDPSKRVRVKNDLRLLEAAADTARFSGVRMLYYRSEFLPQQQSQFAAVTFLLPEGTAVLSFRGTDDTLVGWKEDFNMSFQSRVPAQEKALYYTEAFAAVHPNPLVLCGHSKGGNLAVYAAAQCRSSLQERILRIYNYDGPGFAPSMMQDFGYREIVPKIATFIPESSIIGMLLEHEEPVQVVRSRQVSLMQHELYSWEVQGPRLCKAPQLDREAWHLSLAIKQWLAQRSLQERNEFVDAVYELLTAGAVEKTKELILPKNVLGYLKTIGGDEQLKGLIRSELGAFLQAVRSVRREREAPGLEEGREES